MLRRHPLAVRLVLWTILVVVVAFVMAIGAVVAFNAADQRCFLDYPNTPCPGPDDPALLVLELSFFAMPAIWLVGVIVLFVYQIRRAGRKLAS